MRTFHTMLSCSIVILLVFCLVGMPLIESSYGSRDTYYTISSTESTIYVDDDNTAGPWDGTLDHPFQYIQDGIDVALSGDIVFIFSGFYTEKVTISKLLTVIGEEMETTVIDGSGGSRIVSITANSVWLSNVTVQNGDEWSPGIEVSIARDVTIDKCRIINTGGISFFNASHSSVTSSELNQNKLGISLLSSNHNEFSQNGITENEYGIYAFFDSNDNALYANALSTNDYGLYILGSSHNTIYENNITDNEIGIYVTGISHNNSMHHNMFFSNTLHAFDEYTNTWDDDYPSGGNYWDDYTGVDEDPVDGIGDTPYNISGGTNQDRYPLMDPYLIDTLAPDVTIAYPDDGTEFLDPHIYIEGFATDNVGIVEFKFTFEWSGGNGTGVTHILDNVTYYPFNITFELYPGYNILTIHAQDAAGNKNTDSIEVTYRADTEPPEVIITRPVSELYLFDREIIPFFIPLIIGKIDIEAHAEDVQSDIDRVEFYIDDELMETDDTEPYTWEWTEGVFLQINYNITVIAYDTTGKSDTDFVDVWRFL